MVKASCLYVKDIPGASEQIVLSVHNINRGDGLKLQQYILNTIYDQQYVCCFWISLFLGKLLLPWFPWNWIVLPVWDFSQTIPCYIPLYDLQGLYTIIWSKHANYLSKCLPCIQNSLYHYQCAETSFPLKWWQLEMSFLRPMYSCIS